MDRCIRVLFGKECYKPLMAPDFLADAALWYLAFLFSTVCHEAAHALVAKWGGDYTAYAGGQVTLDPIPHLRREPVGLFILPLLSFVLFKGGGMIGWGSAPYDPYWQIRYPRRAALMAIAGPVSNFCIVLISACLMIVGIKAGVFVLSDNLTSLVTGNGFFGACAYFLSIFFKLNLILGVFNLLPVPPLDGHSALGLILPESTFLKFLELVRTPTFSIVGLLVAYNVFPHLLWPVLQWSILTFYRVALAV